MPTPVRGEDKQKFVDRYMSSPQSKKDFPNEKQRLAVAFSTWEEYNKAREGRTSMKIEKFYDDEQLVFGWASVAKDATGNRPLDWQGDVIDAEDLEQAVYKFNLEFRESNDMHRLNSTNGTLVESIMFTKEKMAAMGIPEGTIPEGWWCGFKLDDQEAYSKVKNGIYKMFSIEGSATRVPMREGE